MIRNIISSIFLLCFIIGSSSLIGYIFINEYSDFSTAVDNATYNLTIYNCTLDHYKFNDVNQTTVASVYAFVNDCNVTYLYTFILYDHNRTTFTHYLNHTFGNPWECLVNLPCNTFIFPTDTFPIAPTFGEFISIVDVIAFVGSFFIFIFNCVLFVCFINYIYKQHLINKIKGERLLNKEIRMYTI